MEKSDVIYQLRHSLELDTIKRDLLFYSGGFGLPALIMLYNEDISGTGVLLALTLLGFWIFYIRRMVFIFRYPEGYVLAECVLSQPHCKYRGAYYFTVSFLLPDGETEILDTHAIFGGGGIIEPIMEDYVNKTAWIAYNPATSMVVVIG